MKLLGSATSPYVRRIRLLLGEQSYEFANLNIYGEDRDELRKHNPAMKIPALIDGDRTLFDSRVIARYLGEKFGHPALSWDQENQLTLIDAANDSIVTLVLSDKSGLDVQQDVMFYNLQHERIERCMRALAAQAADGEYDDWLYPTIALYSLIDWADMRGMYDISALPPLAELRERHRGQPMVAETDPRNAG